MELHVKHLNEVTRLNLSASARISQALRVNDIGTAQRIAASAALVSAPLRWQPTTPAVAPAPRPVTPSLSEHQVDVWA
jgi:hypothetical protein